MIALLATLFVVCCAATTLLAWAFSGDVPSDSSRRPYGVAAVLILGGVVASAVLGLLLLVSLVAGPLLWLAVLGGVVVLGRWAWHRAVGRFATSPPPHGGL